jgi:hypothetical protein
MALSCSAHLRNGLSYDPNDAALPSFLACAKPQAEVGDDRECRCAVGFERKQRSSRKWQRPAQYGAGSGSTRMDKLSNDRRDLGAGSRLSDPAGCLAGGVFLKSVVPGASVRSGLHRNTIPTARYSRCGTLFVPGRDRGTMAARLLERARCQRSEKNQTFQSTEAMACSEILHP